MGIEDEIFDFYDLQNRGFGSLEENPWKNPRFGGSNTNEKVRCENAEILENVSTSTYTGRHNSAVEKGSSLPQTFHVSSKALDVEPQVEGMQTDPKRLKVNSEKDTHETILATNAKTPHPTHSTNRAKNPWGTLQNVSKKNHNRGSANDLDTNRRKNISGTNVDEDKKGTTPVKEDSVQSRATMNDKAQQMHQIHQHSNNGFPSKNIQEDSAEHQLREPEELLELKTSNGIGTIPGPAGVVQKGRYTREDGEAHMKQVEVDDVSSHSPTNQVDKAVFEEFETGAWLSAMDVLDAQRSAEDGWKVSWTTLDYIRKEGKGGRVEQIVGMVKSFELNDFGNACIELKDHTGAISATIPAKIFHHEAMVKDLTCGAVLILKSAVVFSPWHGVQNLNISAKNISHVFPASTPFPPSFRQIRLSSSVPPVDLGVAVPNENTKENPQVSQQETERRESNIIVPENASNLSILGGKEQLNPATSKNPQTGENGVPSLLSGAINDFQEEDENDEDSLGGDAEIENLFHLI